MFGKDIASRVPPPGKLKRAKPAEGSAEEEAGETTDEEAGEDEAANASLMQEFMDIAGLKGDAAESCKALDAYLEAAGFVKR
jgi:hypothetical protein